MEPRREAIFPKKDNFDRLSYVNASTTKSSTSQSIVVGQYRATPRSKDHERKLITPSHTDLLEKSPVTLPRLVDDVLPCVASYDVEHARLQVVTTRSEQVGKWWPCPVVPAVTIVS
jgi:hypothetical protein